MQNPLRRQFEYRFFYASLALIAVNFVFFFATSIIPDLTYYLGLSPVYFVRRRMYWQIFTYMFIHGNMRHILSNMLGLFFFGMTVERALGSKEFLLMYFVCGLASGLCSLAFYLWAGTYNVLLVGASGAVFAIMLAYAVIFPRANIYIWGILPIPSPILVAAYAAIELLSQLTGYKSNVAHYAHLFGFAAAFLYFIVRMGVNPVSVWKNAYFS